VNIYDFSAERIDGRVQSLSEYKGKVLLIVNTASKCGLTPQLEGLEALYRKYRDRGFVVLGFPCNQFARQDPGTNEEIAAFCSVNYGISFPMFAKIAVNGKNAHPLYRYLKKRRGIPLIRFIKWNFTKFLVDRDGRVVARFSPMTKPERLAPQIERLL
jgi:glutathione peroxidase